MKKNQSNSKVYLGFLAGATAGAIAGILLAPETGKDTRKNIANKASQLKDDLNSSLQKGKEKFASFKDSVFSLGNEEKANAETIINPDNFSL